MIKALGAAFVLLLFWVCWKGYRWMDAITDVVAGLVLKSEQKP